MRVPIVAPRRIFGDSPAPMSLITSHTSPLRRRLATDVAGAAATNDAAECAAPPPALPAFTSATASRRMLYGLLAFAFLARLLTLGLYPLTDTTEARYAEIARKMVETGQWLVPQIDYGVPFWGKPPLSMWLTAVSYEIFGVNAFAARLPSLLLGLAVCLLAYRLGAHYRDREYGLRAAVVVATSVLMLVSAGSVMTDPAMLLGTTLSMVGYWLALTTSSLRWGYLFFVGLAIGLLAKGPIATVLTLLPIGTWVLLTGRAAENWHRLPWLRGGLLLSVLVLTWYGAAEMRNPGFLHYFIVGEHVQRFLVPGWNGDLYGVGHAYPRGTIWAYALLGSLPWSPWLLWQLRQRRTPPVLALRTGDGWTLYLSCWMLAPLLFFTLSRNILPTYFLPGLIGFALLVAHVWQTQAASVSPWRTGTLALLMPSLALLLSVALTQAGLPSQQDLIAAYRRAPQPDATLVYFRQRPYSAEFYSRGKAARVDDVESMRAYLARRPHAYVATELKSLDLLPQSLRAQLTQIAISRSGRYVLLRHLDEARTSDAAGSPRGLREGRAATVTGPTATQH